MRMVGWFWFDLAELATFHTGGSDAQTCLRTLVLSIDWLVADDELAINGADLIAEA